MSQIPSFYLIRNVQKKNCPMVAAPAGFTRPSGTGVRTNWNGCSFPELLAELQQQNLPELATQIAPDWDLPADAVESGLKTLRSHLEQAEGGAALLYEMT